MKSFAADIQHWPTVEAFAAHLRRHDPAICSWVKGITLHHTYRPLAVQWRGMESMEGQRRWFRDHVRWTDAQGRKRIGGWTAGPHLYFAYGAPNPAWNGMYQLTPLNMPGNHAISFNETHWGWEVVGDFDRAPWPPSLRDMVELSLAVSLDWLGLSAAAINGHRDDPKTSKTCPGAAIDLDAVRTRVATMLTPVPTNPDRHYTKHSPIMGAPKATLAHAIKYVLSRPHGNYNIWDIVQVILPAYWEQAIELGIDPIIAIAQLIHETGNLCSALSQRRDKDGRNLRNPAGIGVTGASSDQPLPGYVWDADRKLFRACVGFADWVRESIPAHLGRLLAYALAPGAPTSFAQEAAIRFALKVRPLDSRARGSAAILDHLGAKDNPANAGLSRETWVAGWAWDGEFYGEALAEIANAICATKVE